MSPRRMVAADEPDFFHLEHPTRRNWGLLGFAVLVALVISVSAVASTAMVIAHHRDRTTMLDDASALGYVQEFMTMYTTLDPFHANDYGDRVLAQSTGEFAKMFKDRLNEIVITVARAEPTTGSVVSAGVERWNDDGSAEVLVATTVTTKSPDGKSTIESGSRWLTTAMREGRQWKISKLVQVI